jgi:DNA-binding MarR family transcriptional regulator
MKVKFKIQIPTEVIKNPKISHEAFLVYCKLVQHYYVNKGESNILQIDHRKLMYFCSFKSNPTLKKSLKSLYENNLIENQISTLPKVGLIEIILNPEYVKKGKEFSFAQITYEIFDKRIIDTIKYEGIRLLYYFKSHINKPTDYCFSSRETISKEIGSNPKTVDKHIKLLKDKYLIKVERHELHKTEYYETNEFGNEKAEYIKFNNHYFLRMDKLEEFILKMKEEM